MFPSRYFNPRYWAAKYWPKIGGAEVVADYDCAKIVIDQSEFYYIELDATENYRIKLKCE